MGFTAETELGGGPEYQPDSEIKSAINRLNEHFRKPEDESRADAPEALADLRKLPKPILVDFNNTIFNNMEPFTPNPDAREFIDQLRHTGNVVLLTTARSWEAVKNLLVKADLWHDDMVLMVADNWRFMSEYDSHDPHNPRNYNNDLGTAKLVDEFIALRPNFKNTEFGGAPANKIVAPLFNKPFDIPLIDDAYMAVRNNPGIYGILPKYFDPEQPEFHQHKESVSLSEAARLVKEHYSHLSPPPAAAEV